MPGFTIDGTGAAGANVPPANIETRRKHRWYFQTLGDAVQPDILVVLKTATRPKFTYEEAAMHHDQEVAWFAGKQSWDPIALEWYDAEQEPDVSRAMWDWLNKVTNMDAITVETPRSYKKQASLIMTMGSGEPSETWKLFNCWPKELDWKDLDYTSSDIATVAVSMRYDRAQRVSE